MSNETMTYSAWRATFQSGEQAAKSAFDDAKRNFNERQKLALVVEDLARQVGALTAQRDELLDASGLALNEAERWINNDLEGTSKYDEAMAALEPVRLAISKVKWDGL